MKTSTRSVLATTSLLCIALLATDAQAQMGGGMGGMGGMRRGGSGDHASRSADSTPARAARPMLTDRLDQVAAQLLLSREQARAWEAFRAAFMALQRPPGGAVALSESTSALAAMQQKLSQAQDRFALMEALSDALKQLEQEFDAQQRDAADRLLPALLAEFAGPSREGPAGN
jgi:hypothetical protein